MTGTVARIVYDLAVAAVSLAALAATLLALAGEQIGTLTAIFLLNGAALAAFVSLVRLRMHGAQWPITNLAAGFRRAR